MPKDFIAKQVSFRENEKIIVVLHHHPITYAKQIIITAILILLAFFLMFLLFSLGVIGVALFLAILLTGVFYGLREFFIWYFNVFIITNQRIIDIDQKGFFSKTVSESSYKKIMDICYSVHGLGQTILRLGTIKINASGAKLVIENVKQVVEVNQLLADLVKEKTGKKIQVKKVKHTTSKAKEKLTEEFLNQEEMEEYEEFDTDELIEEYIDTFDELSLKKLLIDELDEYEQEDEDEEDDESEIDEQEEEFEDEIEEDDESNSPTNFKKKVIK
jgi:uncharacterized membrane protein YdbT with pleckstrin-like domain